MTSHEDGSPDVSDDGSIIGGMEPTAATPTSATPPAELAWQDESDEVPTATPLFASWRLVAALAASIAVAAALLVGIAWLWTHRVATESVSTTPSPAPGSTTAPTTPPPSALTTTVAAPPPVTLTVTQPPPTPIQAAVPQIPAAAREICEMLRNYPGMNRVDVAMTLSDRTPHRPYDTTRPIVDNAVTNYCPDQAR